MCFTLKKNNKWTKKPVNCFLHDDASVGMLSPQTSIAIKLCQTPWNGLYGWNQVYQADYLDPKRIRFNFDRCGGYIAMFTCHVRLVGIVSNSISI